jgi:hypothetical protein
MLNRAMSELSTLVRRVTQDLHDIQNTLTQAAQPDARSDFRDEVMHELVQANMANELKVAVDHMRHLLWSYLEAAETQGANVAERLQSVRMRRVTEMLRTLQPTVGEKSVRESPESASFFELIHQIANTTVERHRPGSKAGV